MIDVTGVLGMLQRIEREVTIRDLADLYRILHESVLELDALIPLAQHLWRSWDPLVFAAQVLFVAELRREFTALPGQPMTFEALRDYWVSAADAILARAADDLERTCDLSNRVEHIE